jgi:hypothetical protein
MAPLVLCFVSGLAVGAVGHWAARKIYWHYKWPLLNKRHYHMLRFRRYRFYPRRSLKVQRSLRRSYSGYGNDYRLSKLFDRVDKTLGD